MFGRKAKNQAYGAQEVDHAQPTNAQDDATVSTSTSCSGYDPNGIATPETPSR